MNRKAKARRTARRSRGKVARTERVKPPPEAAQHHRPWPMQVLLARGPEGDGIDSDEFEAGIELVETFRALTSSLQAKGVSLGEPHTVSSPGGTSMSDKAAMMTEVWFTWCRDVGPVATQIVEMVEDQIPIRSPAVLRLALRRWLKVRSDTYHHHRTANPQPQRIVDSVPSNMLTIDRGLFSATGDRGHALPITRPSPPTRTQQGQGTGRALTQAAHRPGKTRQ